VPPDASKLQERSEASGTRPIWRGGEVLRDTACFVGNVFMTTFTISFDLVGPSQRQDSSWEISKRQVSIQDAKMIFSCFFLGWMWMSR
jgi:hypothetical protein